MYDFHRRAREYENGFGFEIKIVRDSPATRIFDILRERSELYETRGARPFPVKEAIYRAAGCIDYETQVAPGAVEHFWAQYHGKSFEKSLINIAAVLNHLIIIQSGRLIQGFGRLSAPPIIFTHSTGQLIFDFYNELLHRKLMPDPTTYAVRPVNPAFSIDKMMATLKATLECEVREAVYSPNWDGYGHPGEYRDERQEPPPVMIYEPMKSNLPPPVNRGLIQPPPVIMPKWPLHSDYTPWPTKEIMSQPRSKRKVPEPEQPKPAQVQKNKRLKVDDDVVYLNERQLPWLRRDEMRGVHLVCGYGRKMPDSLRYTYHALHMRKTAKSDLHGEPSFVLYQLYRDQQNRSIMPSQLTIQTWWKQLGSNSTERIFGAAEKMKRLICVYYSQHIAEVNYEAKLWELYGNTNDEPLFFFTKPAMGNSTDGCGYQLIHKPLLPECEPIPAHYRNQNSPNKEQLLSGLKEVIRDECSRARLGLGPSPGSGLKSQDWQEMPDDEYLNAMSSAMVEFDLTEKIGDEAIGHYIEQNRAALLGAKLRPIDVYKQIKTQTDAKMDVINLERRRQRAYRLFDRLNLGHKKPMVQLDDLKRLTLPRDFEN